MTAQTEREQAIFNQLLKDCEIYLEPIQNPVYLKKVCKAHCSLNRICGHATNPHCMKAHRKAYPARSA